MIDLPREPNPGENLDSSWGVRVVRALRALFPTGGPGIHVDTGPTGTTISATNQAQETAPATLATDAIPAVVVQASAVPGLYRVTLYPSGIGGPSGGNAFLACTERGMEMDLPAGTIVLAHSIVLAAADDGDDGVEEEEEGEATP